MTVNRGKTPPTDPLLPRERRVMLIVACVVVVLIAVGAVIWATVSHDAPTDCVSISVPGPMGGAIEHACGGAAREWCQAASLQHDAHSEAVQAQCRAVGILR